MPDDDNTVTTKWEGYSDYQSVSDRISRSIHDAIEAYATIERAHTEGARLKPDVAAQAGGRILTAAINVQTELQVYADENDEYEDLLENFAGEDGYVTQLRDAQLRTDCPDWLYQFVVDIRTAGFELGYLQAGREATEREVEEPSDEAREMFANL